MYAKDILLNSNIAISPSVQNMINDILASEDFGILHPYVQVDFQKPGSSV